MTATLTITPHSPAEKRLELECEHGSTLAYYGDGSVRLTDEDLVRLLGHSHRATFGCQCCYRLEIRSTAGVN